MVEGAKTPLPVDMSGQRVVITAGAGGIGRVMADSFAARGARVFVCDVDEISLAACPYPNMRADMARVPEIDAFMDAALDALDGLDVLINNAGIAGPTGPVEDVTEEALRATMAIDLESMFHATRRAILALRKAGGGSIVNLSSSAGRFGFRYRTPYAAAKWGVVGLTKSLSIELGPDNIRVNCIQPGLVEGARIRAVLAAKAKAAGVGDNEMTQQALANASLGCFITQQDIANMALYLCSPFGATISGQAIAIDGDLQRLT